jgi:hypothetical protein
MFSQDVSWSEPQNINVLNSPNDEFAPVWNRFTDELYFNSNRSGYSKFYKCDIATDRQFNPAQLVEGGINTERNNQSYITFENKEIAYLSTFRKFKNRSYLNIFQTRKKKNQWLNPFKVDSLEMPYFMGHPTVSPDNTFMIFSTNYNSEFGDTDLWMVFKQDNGTWGALVRINQLKTPGNEITPFLANNDTLFFASDGQEGPGGYDVFMSVRVQGVWQMPFPISAVNTEFDESDYTILPDGRVIFASNRPGGLGGLDLYVISKEKQTSSIPSFSKVDFSIEVQVPTIKVDVESIRKTVLVNPVLIYDSGLFDKTNAISLKNEFYKFFDSTNLGIIAEKLSDFKDATLYCSIYSGKLSDEKQNLIKEQISSYFKTSQNRIKFNFSPISKQLQDLAGTNVIVIKFNSNDKRMFESYNLKMIPVKTIIPPALDLSIDARPRNQIKKWNLNLSIGNQKNESIKSANDFPINFYHSITKYGVELNNNDSLILNINAVDSLGNKHEYSQVVNITHSNIEDDGKVLIEGKDYWEFNLQVFDEKDLREEFMYLPSFRFLAEKAQIKKNVIIKYYSEKSLRIANEIKSFLSEQINGKDFKIIIQRDSDSEIPNNIISGFFKIQIEA